jgi:membrane protein DedA with SNARE-associated domain
MAAGRAAGGGRGRGGVTVPDSAAIWFYLGTFGLLLAAGMGLPLPEEVPIIAAGAAVGHAAEPVEVPAAVPAAVSSVTAAPPQGPFPVNFPYAALTSDYGEPFRSSPLPSNLRWWIMFPICVLGAVSGDVFLYSVGRLGGPRILNARWLRRLFPPEKRERTEQNFHRYGTLVLVFARFLPTIRSPIFIMSGIMRIPLIRFILADGIAGIFGVGLVFTLAYWFGDQVRDLVVRAEGKAKSIIIIAVIAAVGVYFVLHFFRKPVTTGDPQEVPLLTPTVIAKMESLHLLPAKPADRKEVQPSRDGSPKEKAEEVPKASGG